MNCCGPYNILGEPVVKACIDAGAHHVDITGEPQFIGNMLLKYNDLAKEKGVYIVYACGLESVPAELGVLFAEENFGGLFLVFCYINFFFFIPITNGSGGHSFCRNVFNARKEDSINTQSIYIHTYIKPFIRLSVF